MTCSSSTDTSTSSNFEYVANGSIGGNFIGINDSATATSNCNMSNTMLNNLYNQVQANTSQTAASKGMFVAIAGSIAGVILLVVIVVIVGGIGMVAFKGMTAKKTQTTQQQGVGAGQLEGLLGGLLGGGQLGGLGSLGGGQLEAELEGGQVGGGLGSLGGGQPGGGLGSLSGGLSQLEESLGSLGGGKFGGLGSLGGGSFGSLKEGLGELGSIE